MDKLLGAIGLCRKAGKLIMGADPVADAVMQGNRGKNRVYLLLTAQDFAPRSIKQVERLSEEYCVKRYALPFTMDELSAITGKYSGVLAICDSGFARMINAILGKADP